MKHLTVQFWILHVLLLFVVLTGESLPSNRLSEIREEQSNITFKFGDGKVVPSLKKITFPCVLAGVQCKIRSDVVDSDIPLLFGKPSWTNWLDEYKYQARCEL